MSFRNSFCTEYIYDKNDEKFVFDKLSKNWDVACKSHIISGLIGNTWCASTPWDLQEVLTGVKTNRPITFAAISEDGDYAQVDICVLENGVFNIKTKQPEKEPVSKDDIVLLLGKWFLALEDEGCDPWKIEECVKFADKYHYTKIDYRKFLNTIV